MSLPTINDVQAVETVLTNLVVGYQQATDRFVASKVFPAVPVPNDSGTYYEFDRRYFFTDLMEERAPGGQYARADFGTTTGTFTTLQWALAYPIADEIRANSQVPMDLERAAAMWLANKSMIRKERAWAGDFMTTGVWGTDGSVTAKFSTVATSDPVGDVLTARRTVSNNTGYDPNTMVMGYIVHQRLVNHPDLQARIAYTTQATQANLEGVMGALFGVSNYWVGKATYNSTNEASAMTTGTAIIDDDLLIAYVSASPGIFEATAGLTFTWAPGGGAGTVMSWRDGENDADLIKMKEQWDQVRIAQYLGYFYADCTD